MFVKEPFAGIDSTLADEIIRKAGENTRPFLYHDNKWYADYLRIILKAIKTTERS